MVKTKSFREHHSMHRVISRLSKKMNNKADITIVLETHTFLWNRSLSRDYFPDQLDASFSIRTYFDTYPHNPIRELPDEVEKLSLVEVQMISRIGSLVKSFEWKAKK